MLSARVVFPVVGCAHNNLTTSQIMKMIKRFFSDERGLETVEYAIIVGLIVAGLIAVIAAIGVWVKAQFDALQTDINA